MRVQRVLLGGLCGLWVATAVWAGSKPVAVSPGDASKLVLIGNTCPTFSWGAVAGAKSYELVVYRVGQEKREVEPVLEQEIPGSASSWTPPLESCLERGGQYAWSLLAVSRRQPSEWSSPSLFEVTAGPSEVEFEAALEVVKSYLAVEREGAESASSTQESTAVEEAKRPSRSELPGTRAAPAATQLSVDGNIDATSFTGDGSNLAGLGNPAGPCFNSTKRFVACTNGTVTDTVTGLIWLENLGCYDTPKTWETANAYAAQLQDGVCGLTDGSRPGDWRLPTNEEWEGILDSSCDTEPKIVGNQSLTAGCYTDDDPDSEWASGVVVSSLYWSSTTIAYNPTIAWIATLYGGYVSNDLRTGNNYVWPVRGGPSQHERIRSVFCPTDKFVSGFDSYGELICDSIPEP